MKESTYLSNRNNIRKLREILEEHKMDKESYDTWAIYLDSLEFHNESRDEERFLKERQSFVKFCIKRLNEGS